MMTTEHTEQPVAKFIRRNDAGWEQFVMGEMLIPDVPNSYGDVYTHAAIKEFAYQFAMQGYGIDINHAQEDVTGQVYVVESFIARAGDPDFIEGSWVVGVKILDADLWQQVLDNEINGFSYEALVTMMPIQLQNLRNRIVSGTTEPDLIDGHTHVYSIVLDPLNRPVSGSTGTTDGHYHTISTHTYTDASDSHRHRYQVIVD